MFDRVAKPARLALTLPHEFGPLSCGINQDEGNARALAGTIGPTMVSAPMDREISPAHDRFSIIHERDYLTVQQQCMVNSAGAVAWLRCVPLLS